MRALLRKLLLIFCCLVWAMLVFGQDCDASFTASETNPCGLEVVTFTVTNPNAGFIYTWDFGDPAANNNNPTGLNDNVTSGELVTHAFSASNTGETYTVTLSVTGEDGVECAMQTLVINTQAAPTAILSSSEPGGVFVQCPEELVSTFDLRVTDNGSGNADSYVIDWGDGSPVETNTIPPSLLSHEYAIGGFFLSYTVVDNSLTCTSSTATYFVYNGTNPGLGIANDENITVCTPDSISFDFEGYETNTDNTLYYITINDGTEVISFTQSTLPPSYTHLFDSISCGTTSGTQIDAYEFIITAVNSCGEKEALIRPIRVGRAPISDFTAEGDDPSCDPSTYTFVSQAHNGVGFVNGECSEDLSLEWIITPLDGGTVTNVLGNAITDSIIRTFSPGEFLIEHLARNSCGSDTARQMICVLPVPDASFTVDMGQNAGCFPHVVNTTNTSNTLNSCGEDATYRWIVGLSESDCGLNPTYTLIDSDTLDTSIDIQFDSSGIYQLGLIVINECGIDTFFEEITVSSPPILTLANIPDSCYYGPVTIFPEIIGIQDCYGGVLEFEWEFPEGTPGMSESENPDGVTYGAPGTYTISVVSNNNCGPTPTTTSFTLLPPPEVPEITNNSPVCVGGCIIFENSMPSGLTYEWSGPNGFTSTVAAPVIEDVDVVDSGIYTLVVTDPNTGCQNQMTYEVIVTTIASLTITPNPANVCLGQAVDLTATGPSSITWQGPNLSSNTGTAVTFTGTELGEFMIIATGSDPDEQCNGTDTVQVNVQPFPVVDAGDNQITCQNTDLQLIGSPDAGGLGTGVWSGPNVSPSGIFNASAPGVYTLTYAYTSEFDCAADATVEVCVQSIPEASFTIDEDFGCDNLTVNPTNTSNTIDDCEAAEYFWSAVFLNDECDDMATGNWDFTNGTNETSVAPIFAFNALGTYEISLIVENSCGPSTAFTTTVTVGGDPTVELAEIDEFCGTTEIDPVFIAFGCNTEITGYAWDFTGTSGSTTTSTEENPMNIPYGVGTYTLSLTVTNVCGNATETEEFQVLQGPVLDYVLPEEVCSGDIIEVMGTVDGDGLRYMWTDSGPTPLSIIDRDSDFPTIDFTGAAVGIYSIGVIVENEVCDPVELSFEILVIDVPTATISEIDNTCDNITFDPQADYSISVDLIDSVRWTFPAGSMPTTSTELNPGPVTQNTTGFGQEVILTVYNACGSSTVTETFDLLVGPMLDLALDTNFVCIGNSVTVINNSLGDNLDYSWTVSPMTGVTIDDASSPTPIFTFNGEVGEHTIMATVGNELCGNLTWMSTVLVSDVPTATITPIDNTCDDITFDPQADYSISVDLIDSVRWTFPVGSMPATSTELDPGPVTQNTTGFGQEVILTVYNACGSSTVTETFDLLVGPMLDLALDTNFVCIGNSVTVINNSLGDNLDYTWTVSPMTGVTIDDASSPTPIFTFNGEVGEHTIMATVGNELCGNLTWMSTVLVSDVPTATITPIDNTCDDITFDPQADYSISVDLIDSVRWTFPVGSMPATSTELDPGPVTQNTTGFGQEVILTVYNACGSSTVTETFDLLVGPMLDLALDTNFVCIGNSVTVINNSLGDNLEYSWTVSPMIGVTIDDASSPTPIFTFNGEVGEHTIMAMVGNELCGNLTWMSTVLVSDVPTATITPIDNTCDDITFDPQADYSISVDLIDSVRWTFPAGSMPATSTELDPDPVTQNTTGFGQEVILTVYNACGSSTVTENFDLLVGPMLDLALDTNFVCIGNSVTVINNSLGDNLDYTWTVSPMTGVTIDDASSPTPIFTFNGEVGEHTIMATVGNELCGNLTWMSTVLVSDVPTATITPIDNTCDDITFDPQADYSIPVDLIDSVRWTFPLGSMPATSTELDPGPVTQSTTGFGQEVILTVYNACGSTTVTETFDLLVGPMLDLALDTNFVCLGNSVTVINNSLGDDLEYAWMASPMTGVTIEDVSSPTPIFTFNGALGEYIIAVVVGNDLCGTVEWSDTVLVNTLPEIILDTIPNFCEEAALLPGVGYGIPSAFLDSVRWTLTANGGIVYNELFIHPDSIPLDSIRNSTNGSYELTVTATNNCGTSVATRTFEVLEGPVADFVLSSDMLCVGDTIFVTNQSTGSDLIYNWIVDDPAFTLQSQGDSTPIIIVNGPIGDYVIRAEVSNAECSEIPWLDTVNVNAPPLVLLDSIPNFCEEAALLPGVDYGIPSAFLDSVRWTLTANGGIVYNELFIHPDSIPLDSIRNSTNGSYELTVTATNNCGTSVTTRTFEVLEGPVADFVLSSDMLCVGDTIFVTNQSTGSDLIYNWIVDDPAFTLQSQGDSTPIIIVNGPIGDYVIRAEVSNAECSQITWLDTVNVSEAPFVMLDSIADACDGLVLSPEVTYSDTAFIEAYLWTVFNENDSLLYSFDTQGAPEITFGVGTYTIYNEITNRCGMAMDSVSFQVYASPELSISIDPDFVCADGDNTVTVTNNSTGNITDYFWSADGQGTVIISDPTAGGPVFTFPNTGLYVLNVEVSNPVCESVSWMDTVLVSEAPIANIDELGTYCGEVLLEPLASFSDTSRIDSVRWLFPGGTPETATTFVPGEVFYANPGLYTVSVMVYNECGAEADVATFQVFEPIDINASLSDTFSCTVPFEVIATNESTGDSLNYDWDVNGPFADNVTFDLTTGSPIFTFPDTGVYEVILRVSNDICGEQFWRDTVTILTLPEPLLTGVDEFCNEVSLTPEIDYYTYRVDSVRWDFTGSEFMPPTSSELFPTGVPYVGAGTYTYGVTVYNACGAVSLQDTFVIDTIPEVNLGPTDTICITDGLFMLPIPDPPGGIWRDSLGRLGVVTEGGVFDPEVAGGGVAVLEYEYNIGACVVFTYKEVFVVDLTIEIDPDPLDVCVSESAYILNNGIPAGGWYEGEGVTQDNILNATSLGVGVFTLTYYYQLPGTDCVESQDFTVNVQPLPAPEISITDSLCVNVPVQMFDAGTGADAYVWNISDGSTYTAAAPFHTFTSTGTHTIQLITTSIFDCVDSTEIEVFVSGPPETLFEMDTTMGCAILPVNFDNLTNGYEFVSYEWDFGNGETSTLGQPGTVFYDQGIIQDTTYFVTLTATNHCGTDTYQDSAVVFPRPLARMDLSQQIGCTPLYVEFNNLTVGLPETFAWYINGELYSTDSIPSANTFVTPDSMNVTYEVMLIADNDCGSDTTVQNIIVQPDIIRAFFSVDSQVGCSPFTVMFNNSTSPDSIITYDWFFGDGASSQDDDPEHTFYATGDTTTIYQVTLIADNGCGRDSLTIPITVNPEPYVAFSAPPITCTRDTVFFTNLSVDVTNPIWSFGDGDTLTMIENPGHVYQNPGTYTVTLTAFAIGTGCPSTYTDTVFIREIPLANLTAGPLFGCPDLEVTFTNESEDALFYEWNFGDGNTAVGEGPLTHSYTIPGVYQATLIATDEFGCANDTISSEIIVYEVPEIDFTFETDRDCGVPTEACFTNLTVNGGGYLWDFGNGNIATENDPCEDYMVPGIYPVTLTATNAFECTTTLTRDLEIYGEPLARINGADTTLCIPGELVLTHDSEYATFVEWRLSNGIVSNMDSLIISPVDTGVLDVTLIVGNESGCTDTLTLEEYLRIYPTPTAAFDFNLLTGLPSFTYSFTDMSSADATFFYWNFGDSDTIFAARDTLHEFIAVNSKRVTHWVENRFGCVDTAFAVIDFPQEGHLYIPNILEPELLDDGKNTFQPKGIGLIDYHIAVYARNGQLVWESSAIDEEGSPTEGWNGTYQGELMPPGTFVWKVHRAVFLGGGGWKGMANQRNKKRTSGYLYLVR